jgi:hypothetical protein
MTQEALARRMFLILHDPFSGRPEVEHTRVKGGVVAASLAELIMEGRLGMDDDRVVVLDPRAVTDEIAGFVIQNIQHQRRALPVKTWVDALGDVLYELVARWLVTDGVVRREPGSRRLVRRGPDHFPAIDLLRSAGPRVRLEHMLRTPRDLDPVGVALAGIIRAIEADRVLDVDRDRGAVKSSLNAAAQQLPDELMSLVDGVQSALFVATYKMRRF